MANLGDNNTPVEGESFGLPSGFSIDEENGDLVIRDTDGTVAMRRADGTWELESDLALNENDISGVGAFDSESVNTESLVIDGVLYEKTDEHQQSGATSSTTDVNFDGLEDNSRYVVRFGGVGSSVVNLQSAGTIEIFFNDDDSGESYTYFDESGTKLDSENTIELLDVGSVSRVTGDVIVQPTNESSSRTRVENKSGAGRAERLDGFATKGGRNQGEPLTKISIRLTGGIDDGNIIELWEAIA